MVPGSGEGLWSRKSPRPTILDDAGLCAVFAALGAGRARLVGGAVRDVLAGLSLGDLDVVTSLVPQEVMAALARAGVRGLPTGLAHGTVTALIDGRHIGAEDAAAGCGDRRTACGGGGVDR